MAFLTQPSRSIYEPVSIVLGLVAFVSGLLYFLKSYGIISIPYEISNETLLLFFTAMTLICGIILILSTIGMFGVR